MSIGERLREERERLGFTQPAFAGLAETTKKSQIDYEKDLTQPKAGYLAAIAKVNADVQYIVTGVRSAEALGPDEEQMVRLFRTASIEVKAAAIGALKGAESTQQKNVQKVKKGVGQQFNAPVGSVTSGNISNSRKTE